jgi:hypothetical protein
MKVSITCSAENSLEAKKQSSKVVLMITHTHVSFTAPPLVKIPMVFPVFFLFNEECWSRVSLLGCTSRCRRGLVIVLHWVVLGGRISLNCQDRDYPIALSTIQASLINSMEFSIFGEVCSFCPLTLVGINSF